jgi:hypothetical protein
VSVLVPPPYAELSRVRLALGLEPRDALTGARIVRPLDAELEGAAGARVGRHDSGRFAIAYARGIPKPPKPPAKPRLDVRLLPRDRRYVPRRLRFEIASLKDVTDEEKKGTDIPTAQRAWRPLLYPGAAADVGPAATGLRGFVTTGTPKRAVRWTRVQALVGSAPVGYAHGDDRGEFLLVVGPAAATVADLKANLEVTIVVYAAQPEVPRVKGDELGDLPLETDADGTAIPSGYAEIKQLTKHSMALGRLTSVPIHV